MRRQGGDNVGGPAARAEFAETHRPACVVEAGGDPVRWWSFHGITPGRRERDQVNPVRRVGRRQSAKEDVVDANRSAAGSGNGVTMFQFDVGETGRHDERAVGVGPISRVGADDIVRREIEGIRSRGTVVRVFAGPGRAPFEPMLRWLRDASALEEATKAVKATGANGQAGVGRAVLAVLRNRAVIAFIDQSNLHRFAALVGDVRRGDHVGPVEVAGEPFVPMAVVIFLEAAVGHEVAIERGKNGERRGVNRVGFVNGPHLINVLAAGLEQVIGVGGRVGGERDDMSERAFGLFRAIDAPGFGGVRGRPAPGKTGTSEARFFARDQRGAGREQ